MSDCIFCKIASGEIPTKKIYEDNRFIAFLDVNPRARGHILIIPKKHAQTLTDMKEEDTGAMFQIVRHIAKIATERLAAKGYNIGSNNGELAGQAVPHFHIHILPRYEKDKHHAGFEAAFQVDESAKGTLDDTLKTITRGTILPPIIIASSPRSEPKKEENTQDKKTKKEEPNWHFKDRETILEDNINY